MYRILDIAEKENIQVTLIRMPLHPDAEAAIPAEYINVYHEHMQEIKSNTQVLFI